MKNILEWVYCVVIALVLALIFRYFVATPTIVRQRSMYPTLQENQRLILNRTFKTLNNEKALKKMEISLVNTFCLLKLILRLYY